MSVQMVGTPGERRGDGFNTVDICRAGPVTRGALWKIIAVPDIRVQAPKVADRAVAVLRLE
jgi:uncharacterized NAD(P)/FAD-binding protein YdhS